MSAQPEALRLAEFLEMHWCNVDMPEAKAAAELRRLHASCEDYAQHKQRQDRRVLELAERVLELKAQRDALLEALKEITPSMPPVDAPCHYGIVPQEKCGHCGRIAKARAAIKAVEEGK